MENSIKCPECGADLNKALYHQLDEEIKKEYNAKWVELNRKIETQRKDIELEKIQLKEEREKINSLVEEEVQTKLKTAKNKQEEIIRKQIQNETSEQLKSLEAELQLKSNQVKELNKAKAEIEKLKRDKDELKEQIVLEKEKEYSEKLKDEKLRIKKQVDEENVLKIKEKEKIIDDLKIQIEEAKRKAEQGSERLQGEVQELAIEEILSTLFPFDLIEPVEKGVRGADIIHTVRNKFGTNAGKIVYESKRTKSFSNEWIPKLKSDAIAIKGDIFVIVTETLPEGIDKIGIKEGVWICSFQDLKGLVLVLRESLIKIYEAFGSQTNKGEKMEMLYNYLISTEFINQVSAIVEGFNSLQKGYINEKKAMERIWKEREKQLEKVLLNTNHFIGSIKGIAGASIPEIKMLEGGNSKLIEEATD